MSLGPLSVAIVDPYQSIRDLIGAGVIAVSLLSFYYLMFNLGSRKITGGSIANKFNRTSATTLVLLGLTTQIILIILFCEHSFSLCHKEQLFCTQSNSASFNLIIAFVIMLTSLGFYKLGSCKRNPIKHAKIKLFIACLILLMFLSIPRLFFTCADCEPFSSSGTIPLNSSEDSLKFIKGNF